MKEVEAGSNSPESLFNTAKIRSIANTQQIRTEAQEFCVIRRSCPFCYVNGISIVIRHFFRAIIYDQYSLKTVTSYGRLTYTFLEYHLATHHIVTLRASIPPPDKNWSI